MTKVNRIFILLAFLGLSTSAIIAQTYPQNGVVGHVSFNNSMEDKTGNITFTNTDCAPVWVEGVDGKVNTAQRFNLESDDEHSCRCHYSIKNLKGNVETFVWTFRLDDVKNHSFATVSPYGFSIENGKIAYEADRDSVSSKKDKHLFDIGLKDNQWITLVSTWDYAKHTVTFYANGKKYAINNHSVKLSSRNGYTKTDRKEGGLGSYQIDVDEIYVYNRALTESELIALCGVNGEIVEVERSLAKASVKMNWQWALIQLAVAVLCLFFLNVRRKEMEPLTVTGMEIIRGASDQNGVLKDEAKADELIERAFSDWGALVTTDNPEYPYMPMRYPGDKKEMQRSVTNFQESLQYADPKNSDFLTKANIFVKAYNAAYTRVFNGKWWIILIAVAAVYVRGLIDGADTGLIGSSSDYTAMPDGFFPQIWYLSKYVLPGVIISAITYFACSFEVRYRSKKDTIDVAPKHLDTTSNNKRMFIIAGMAVGGGLLATVGGAVAGVVAVFALIAVAGYAALNMFVKHGSQKEVWTYSSGRKETHETMNPAGIMLAVGIFVAAVIAVYLISGVVIFLFNIIFIYQFIRNFIFKKG